MAIMQSIIDPVYGTSNYTEWKDGPGDDHRPIDADALNAFDDNIKLAQYAVNELFETLYESDSSFENTARRTAADHTNISVPVSRITKIINELIGSDLLTTTGLPTSIKKTITDQLKAAKELIDAEVGRAQGAEQTLQDSIDAEADSREAGDNVIKNEWIGDRTLTGLPEGATVLAKIQKLFQSLQEEVTTARTAERTLTLSINSEIDRAKEAEQKIETDLSAEVERAKGSENTLESSIETTSENLLSLQQTVSNNKLDFDAYVAETNQSISNIKTKNTQQDTQISELSARASSSEENIRQLQNKIGATGDVTSSIKEAKDLAQSAKDAADTAQNEVDALETIVSNNSQKAEISYTEQPLPEGTISNIVGVLKQGGKEIEIKVPTAAASPLYWVDF